MVTESQTQTFISAWPGKKDRRTPKWVAAPSAYYAGSLCAVTLAIMLRISVLTRATCFGFYTIGVGAAITSWGCGILTRIPGQLPFVPMYFRLFRDIWENKCLLFTYLAGFGMALGSVLVVYGIWIVGIAYSSVFFITGNVLTCLAVDYWGLGWNQRKKIRPGHVQACVLLILGASFLQFDLFIDPHLLETTSSKFALLLSCAAGSLFALDNVALAELSPLMSSRARGMSFSLARMMVLYPTFAYLFLPAEFRSPVIPLDKQELWFLLPVGSVCMALCVLAAHVAASEGSTLFNIKFWCAFSLTAFVIVSSGLSSLPPRTLDISHLIGLGFVCGAVVTGRACSKKGCEEQLAAVPNRRHGDDHCEICIKNDVEISRIQRELQDQQQKAGVYDSSIVITGRSGGP